TCRNSGQQSRLHFFLPEFFVRGTWQHYSITPHLPIHFGSSQKYGELPSFHCRLCGPMDSMMCNCTSKLATSSRPGMTKQHSRRGRLLALPVRQIADHYVEDRRENQA